MKQTPQTKDTVWLDTNFVVQMGKPKMHLAEQMHEILGPEFEIGLSPAVQAELKQRLTDKNTALPTRLGLKIIDMNAEQLGEKKGLQADDELLELARQGGCICTLDSALRKRIKAFGGRVLYLKKGNRIASA